MSVVIHQLGADITLPNAASSDYFGASSSLNGDGTIVVGGAKDHDAGGLTSSGGAAVFKRIGQSIWYQLGATFEGGAAGDALGSWVSINDAGDRVAISAPGASNDNGLVKVFAYSAGTASWSQLGSDITGTDYFGRGLSLNDAGDIVAVGIPFGGTSSYAGIVRVFQYSGGSWSQIGSDINGDASWDQLGGAIALNGDGDIMAVGAINNDTGGSNAGRVKVYQYSAGSWSQVGSNIDGTTANEQLGTSVALNEAGDIVAIGVPKDSSGGADAGQIRVYQYSAGSWSRSGSSGVAGINGAVGEKWGTAVGINAAGDVLVARGSEQAQAFIKTTDWYPRPSTAGTITTDYNIYQMSASMSNDGSVFSVGVPYGDSAAANAGQIQVYYLEGLVPEPSEGAFITSGPIGFSGSYAGSVSKFITEQGGAVPSAGGISLSGLFAAATGANLTLPEGDYSPPHGMSEFYGAEGASAGDMKFGDGYFWLKEWFYYCYGAYGTNPNNNTRGYSRISLHHKDYPLTNFSKLDTGLGAPTETYWAYQSSRPSYSGILPFSQPGSGHDWLGGYYAGAAQWWHNTFYQSTSNKALDLNCYYGDAKIAAGFTDGVPNVGGYAGAAVNWYSGFAENFTGSQSLPGSNNAGGPLYYRPVHSNYDGVINTLSDGYFVRGDKVSSGEWTETMKYYFDQRTGFSSSSYGAMNTGQASDFVSCTSNCNKVWGNIEFYKIQYVP